MKDEEKDRMKDVLPFVIGLLVGLIALAATAGNVPLLGTAPTLDEIAAMNREGKLEEAEAGLLAFVNANPYHGEAWSRLADIHYRQGHWDEGAAAYARAFGLGHWPSVTAYNAACCHALAGRPDDALDWLQHAIDSGYSDLDHLAKDADLTSVRTKLRYRAMMGVHIPENLTRDEGWRHDLASLVQQLEHRHHDPYGVVDREEFAAAVERLDQRIPELKDHEVVVELLRLVASVGDGHTNLWFPGYRFHGHHTAGGAPEIAPFHRLPLRVYKFRDGWFVESASPEYRALVGKPLLTMGSTPVEEVFRAVTVVCSRDNDMTVLDRAPTPMVCPEILDALGVISGTDAVAVTVQGPRGPERLKVKPVAWDVGPGRTGSDWVSMRDDCEDPEPAYLRNESDWHWFEDQGNGLLYVKFGQVRDQDGDETVEEFCRRLFAHLEAHPPEKLALDIRMNDGGNSFLNRPIVQGLARNEHINQKGRLFTIVGRRTFSAAMCLAVDLERNTETLFVGEPTGSSPNFVGETSISNLPWSGLPLSVSTLYWQNSDPQDRRTWIPPDLIAELSSDDYRYNHDPALEAVRAYGVVAGTAPSVVRPRR